MYRIRMISVMIGCIIIAFAGMGKVIASPGRIALLLPLRGPYRESAEALRDGFLASYYQFLPQDAAAPTIRIVDTSEGDILTLYKQIVEQGVDTVVGPLNKDQGMQLLQVGVFTVPTLVLNTLSVTEAVPNLYQLGLAPEDEVKQAADKAWEDGKKNALIIVPASAWGQRLSQIFLADWQSLGGKTVGEMFYDTPQQLSTQISQILQVEQSEKRAKALQQLLHQPKMRTIPYRRQDLDMVFLVAKPEFGRQIRPLLNFYYAQAIPVYATSQIYGGFPEPQYDKDLNNVQFCAIPWEIAPQTLPVDLQAIQKNIEAIWTQAARKQPQFFALGVDSYRLARQIENAQIPPETEGATGKLILQTNHVWSRQLPWAEMNQGQPRLIRQP